MVDQAATRFTGFANLRKVLTLAMASLLAAAMITLVAADKADAQIDSDGYVPVYSTCYAGYELGYYSWYSDGYTTSGEIYVNDCALQALGAGPADRQRVVDHEWGHAMGYGHSADPNHFMYAIESITGF